MDQRQDMLEAQVEELLAAPATELSQAYHAKVCRRMDCAANVEVRSAGPNRGKGVFACRQFERGDAIFRERPLVAIQHAPSSTQALVCSHCFRFLGSIEEQVARKLLHTLRRMEELSQQAGKAPQQRQQQQQHQGQAGPAAGDGEAGPSGVAAVAAPGAAAGSARPALLAPDDDVGGDGPHGEEEEEEEKDVDPEELEELSRRVDLIVSAGVSQELLTQLASGEKQLPHSNRMPLPKAHLCRSSCGAQYCGTGCEAAAWSLHHRLLCCGPDDARAVASSSGPSHEQQQQQQQQQQQCAGKAPAAAGSARPAQALSKGGTAMAGPSCADGSTVASDRTALRAFYRHAATSNEIFGLAAKVLAVTALRADAALRHSEAGIGAGAGSSAAAGGAEPASRDQQEDDHWPVALAAADAVLKNSPEGQEPVSAPGTSLCAGGGGHTAGPSGADPSATAVAEDCAGSGYTEGGGQGATANAAPSTSAGPSSSTAASLGCPPAVWDALRSAWLPFACGWKRVWWESVAVPPDVEDEVAFRQQLRSLAHQSLTLLRAALPSHASRYAPLFSERVYGAVVGMFELNNLALSVPTPVEDYFLMIDALPEAERVVAQADSQPLLDALDKSYDEPCEGTAFYALQSCANHSCSPLATAEGEGSGEMSILALRTILPGQEITISYIDEELGLKERQQALRDYGFKCTCEKCEREKAQRAKKAGAKRPAARRK